MNFKRRQSLALGLMLSPLIANAGYSTQQSVVGYHLGRQVDPVTANAFVNNPKKLLEYKEQVQPLSDMSPKEYVKIKEDKPTVPV